MKTIRFILWGIACLFFLVHAVVVTFHTALVFQQGAVPGIAVAGYWLLVLLAAVILAVGLKKGRIAGNNGYLLLVSALVVMAGVGTTWLAADAPAVVNDYSEKDVACPSNGSFEHLAVFNTDESQGPETSGPDGRPDIAEAWDDIRKRRNAIDALDRFDRICDLPEAVAFTAEIPFLSFRPLRDTANIYGQYFLANVSAGQPREATEAFCRLNRVARKGLDNATLLIHKMIFAGLVEQAIETTWTALQNENLDRQTLISLHENFSPIEFEEISLARPLISEYLIMKNTMRGLVAGRLMDSVPMPGNTDDAQAQNPLLSRAVYFLGFKPNRSLADMKIYYDRLIEAGRRHPVDLSQADAYMKAYAQKPPIRNMVGWVLNSMAMPDLSRYIDRLAATRIKSDLLALSINRRLGQTLALTDYYTGRELQYREEGGLLRHPGPDGVFDTPDDVVLGKKADSDR
ncbi:hypothetical protein [Desulfosudis oleivorans]|uniref:Uncharacterized protein n=1 Tax=Desulfosudis oleivorans (strain DSM 6200 / JCM 39069 / Hxd3) TaxID=96561 RepID=A8ZVD4_DESOH|nr:hypothetical protein [Desulfosudis oleivorans]ABW66595.1 hypothetical protein Dole_0785 [Desulfosudis oleivorans Hxd3]